MERAVLAPPPSMAAPMGEDRCPDGSRWGWGHLQWEGAAHWNTPPAQASCPSGAALRGQGRRHQGQAGMGELSSGQPAAEKA